MMSLARAAAATVAAFLLVTLGSGSTSASANLVPHSKALRPLTLGFSAGADAALSSGSAPTQARWIQRADTEGTQIVRLDVEWNQVAPARLPAGFDASNPADPHYNWSQVDEHVRALAAAHLRIMITIERAPRWAEGPNKPIRAVGGTWKPNARDLGQFARAITTRYSGSFADPLAAGASLPRVSIWQAWDEPNLPDYLSPQWRRSSKGDQPVSPGLYRSMENAFYSAVKGVNRSNYVVLAGLGPYGDSPSMGATARMRPVAFERALLCVTQQLTRQPGCGGPTTFDAIDSHPYGIGGPNWKALWADDVSIPDVHKLVRVLHAAERLGTSLPHGPKGNWVTETSWDTNPPDPHGVPIQEQARWLEQALFNLWKQGVSTVLWWQIVDSPPIPNYASSYQAGVYYLNGRAKPSATSFRFPFVTWRTNYKTVMCWSRAPITGAASIQERIAGSWRTLTRVRVAGRQVFEVPLHLVFKAILRAKLGTQTSLPWTQSG